MVHLLAAFLLLVAYYNTVCARAGKDALLILLPEHGGSLGATYGNEKAAVFRFLSWDNKLRYCSLHNIQCLVGLSKKSRTRSLHPRLFKIRKMLHALNRCAKRANMIYMDTDTVLTNGSTNLFSMHFFAKPFDAEGRLGLSLDLNYTYATKHNLLPGELRYQTGVILLKSPNAAVRLLLQDWMLLSSVLEKEGSPVHATNGGINATSVATLLGVNDSAEYHSDQWLFNELLRRKPEYRSIVDIIEPRDVLNAFPAYSDSCCTHAVFDSATAIKAVRAVEPAETVAQAAGFAAYWKQLGIPNGDEVIGKSTVVHFAGIFGGSSTASGATDVMVLLLAVHGFVVHHLAFVEQLLELDSTGSSSLSIGAAIEKPTLRSCLDCSVVDNAQAAVLLRHLLRYTEHCVHKAFSTDVYVQDRQNVVARKCLAEIQVKSMQLFTNATRTVEPIRKLNKSVFSCC